jgi:hypothetical protein
LCLKDKTDGKISRETLYILRTLETSDKKYVRDITLCGSSTIKRVAAIVENFARTFIPFHISALDPKHGKGKSSN